MSYRFPWQRLTDDQLLDMRICDLPIKIEGRFSSLTSNGSTMN